jgi:ABC-2 type transport system ATP-binding protein
MPAKLTVWENLDYLSYLYQIKDRKKRVQRVSDIFHLNSLLRRSISELSAGQKTRVNLAKAFINFPKVLLLDEPTASLDPDVAEYIRNFLINEQEKFKTSIIFTSHNMAEVEDVCDRVIFVNHGKIIANDTPENLAKTIEICHVELIVKDGLKRTVEYCQNHGYQYKLSGRSIIVDVKEKEIAEFLRGLMDKGVYYDGISIEKPTLEDYFLKNL